MPFISLQHQPIKKPLMPKGPIAKPSGRQHTAPQRKRALVLATPSPKDPPAPAPAIPEVRRSEPIQPSMDSLIQKYPETWAQKIEEMNWWHPYPKNDPSPKEGTIVDKTRAVIEFPFKAGVYSSIYAVKCGVESARVTAEGVRSKVENYPPVLKQLSYVVIPVLAFCLGSSLGATMAMATVVDDAQHHLNAPMKKSR